MRRFITSIILALISMCAMSQPDTKYVSAKEMQMDFEEGMCWQFYEHDSVFFYVAHDTPRDCGRNHKVYIYIENHSDHTIEYNTKLQMQARGVANDGNEKRCRVYTMRGFDAKMRATNIAAGVLSCAFVTLLAATTKAPEPAIDFGLDLACDLVSNRKAMMDRYYEPTRLEPGQVTSGHVFVKKVSSPYFLLSVNVDGRNYRFGWQKESRHYWVPMSITDIEKMLK